MRGARCRRCGRTIGDGPTLRDSCWGTVECWMLYAQRLEGEIRDVKVDLRRLKAKSGIIAGRSHRKKLRAPP